LASGYKSLLVDCPHPINGIIMAFKNNLDLFFSFPTDNLMIVSRSDEIVAVKAVDI
jgi:hypothetical protein